MCVYVFLILFSFSLEFCHPDLLEGIWNDTLNFCSWRMILPESSLGVRRSPVSLGSWKLVRTSEGNSLILAPRTLSGLNLHWGIVFCKSAGDTDSDPQAIFESPNLRQLCWTGGCNEPVFSWELSWIWIAPDKHFPTQLYTGSLDSYFGNSCLCFQRYKLLVLETSTRFKIMI